MVERDSRLMKALGLGVAVLFFSICTSLVTFHDNMAC